MSGRQSFGVGKFKGLLLVGCFSLLVEFLLDFASSVIAGNLLGAEGLSGVNMVQPICSVITFVAGMIGTGMGVNYALAIGRCDKEAAHGIFSQGLWTALICGSLMALAGWLFRGAYIDFLGASDGAAKCADAYLTIYLGDAVLEPLQLLFLNCCYVDGDKKLCVTSYVVDLVVKVPVAIAGIELAGLGAGGCALGSLAGSGAAIAILSLHFLRKTNSFRLLRRFRFADTVSIFKSACGDSSTFLCSAVVTFLVAKLTLAVEGPEMMPVVSLVIMTYLLTELFDGLGVALQPIASVYFGEDNTVAVKRVVRSALSIAAVVGSVIMLALLVYPDVLIKVVGMDDQSLVGPARAAVRFAAVCMLPLAFGSVFNSFFAVIGREGLAVLITVSTWMVAPSAAMFALAPLGPYGVWAGFGFGMALGLVAFWAVLIAKKGVSSFPYLIGAERDARIYMFDLELDDARIAEVARAVSDRLRESGASDSVRMRASLMTEEVLMVVKDHNAPKRVLGEVTLDLNDGVSLTIRDDGVVFDITDADQQISSLRTFLVASVMERQKHRMNLLTTGFNRNVFKFR